jgi:hypothetical protein
MCSLKTIIHQSQDGLAKIDVRMEEGTLWLTQQQLAGLFQVTKQGSVD